MLSKSKTLNRNLGAALGLVAALALVLAIIGAAFFGLSLIFGGSREVRNAVDAGALNVGKKSLTLTVRSNGGDEDQFSDVADVNGEFGLANINRVWGKALWAGINASATQSNGHDAGAVSHAQSMAAAAESISNRLADKLKTPSNLYSFFDELALPNSVRMLGSGAHVQALHNASNWQTSLLDRQDESNLSIDMGQMPDGFSESGNVHARTPQNGRDSKTYLPGYQAVSVLGHNYWFVPFHFDERPRLEAGNHFQENTVAARAIAWGNPVPNTFSVEGKSFLEHRYGQRSMSWVKTNPQVTYPQQIPHGFIRIKVQKNTARWISLSVPPNYQTTNYRFTPADIQTWTTPVLCGEGTATVSLGQEYSAGTLLGNVLFIPLTFLETIQLRSYLTQRIQEINPAFDGSQLMPLLDSTSVNPLGSSDQTFYIFFDENIHAMTVADEFSAPARAPWLASVMNTSTDSSAQTTNNSVFPCPNFVVSWIVIGSGACEGTSETSESEQLDWNACSGWNGCLGELTVHRTTTITLVGGCTCYP
jgi:hypothetical protein